MPINASHEFWEAQKKYDEAKTPLEKLIALQEMKRHAPKHKGGENLRREISQKLAQIKIKMEKQKESAKKAGKGAKLHVKKEGEGQIALIGFPNSGKSTLLKSLTNADVEISSYPFTTTRPQQGMIDFKGARLQLVEVPAIIEGSSKGKMQGNIFLSIVRNSDAVLMIANSVEEFQVIEKELRNVNIWFAESRPKIEIKVSEFPGISITGKQFLKIKEEELIDFLKAMGLYNCSVVLNQETTIEKVAQVLDEKIDYKKGIILTRNKEIIDELKNKTKAKILSWGKEEDLIELKKELMILLNKILIYTKKPGSEPDFKEPLVLNAGDTVENVARMLHKDFAQKLKAAKVWGSTKFPGQQVSKNYELKNGDIIEMQA